MAPPLAECPICGAWYFVDPDTDLGLCPICAREILREED